MTQPTQCMRCVEHTQNRNKQKITIDNVLICGDKIYHMLTYYLLKATATANVSYCDLLHTYSASALVSNNISIC